MGPKQSSPAAAGTAGSAARLRAYSGSDLPSSTSTALRFSTANPTAGLGNRTRFGPDTGRPSSLFQPTIIPTSGPTHSHDQPDPDEERGQTAPRLLIGSLPAHLSPHLLGAGFHCPVCSKFVASDEMDLHIIMCLTKPRLTYNEDVLTKDSGECAICLDDMMQGDTIARLPCLCIYHKGCIDEWFEVNRSCPEHPTD